jgi:hypothetical protein
LIHITSIKNQKIQKIEVYSMNGIRISSINLKNSSSGATITSPGSAGIYVVQITTNKGKAVKKIVVE